MIDPQVPHINALWATMIIDELVRLGADQFVLSPGSRCTPLAAAVGMHPKARNVVHFDERGAAFYALGYARATGRPAVLICTSGTATANYYPAVIEASMDMVPMIVLTADRPAKLRNTGANQTIDQVNLYGRYVRHFFDLPCPDPYMPPDFVLKTIDRAFHFACNSPAGPVHINCQYNEPLAPLGPMRDFSSYLTGLEAWITGNKPFTLKETTNQSPKPSDLERLSHLINDAGAGILLVGQLRKEDDISAVRRLAECLNWPLFADIRSGLRLGNNSDNLIACYDQLLLAERVTERMKGLTVLQIGSLPTSKRLSLFLENNPLRRYVQVLDHFCNHDPVGRVTDRFQGDIAAFCEALTASVTPADNYALFPFLREANERASDTIRAHVDKEGELTEYAVARIVSHEIKAGSGLFLGSSMPIRDMDMYADPHGNPVRVIANRGASGIDGGIASFLGFVHGLKAGGTAVVGDLALLHDLNSLALVKDTPYAVTIVVINNNGGGIFSFLPIAERRDLFERYFGTPHSLTFEKAAEMFGLDYFRVNRRDEFAALYGREQSNRPRLIEVVTDRSANHKAHLVLENAVRTALDKL